MNPVSTIFKYFRRHKAFAIVTLAFVMLVSGGFVAFKMILNGMAEAPSIERAGANFEYTTVSSLKSDFYVTPEELEKSINDYDDGQAWNIYKRAYFNFLNTSKYRILTTGSTLAAGINVSIFNEKKFDGTNFYMHIVSDGGNSTFSAASNNETEHLIYVTDDNAKNVATVKRYTFGTGKLKSKDVITEKDYMFNFGVLPYAACNFVIRENTITASDWSYDEESGLYKVSMTLDPVASTTGLTKQMYRISGTDATYEGGAVKYIAYIDSSFILRKTKIIENYSVSTMGLTFAGKSNTSDVFYYVGDENFFELAENEKYDLKDIPVQEDDQEVAFTKQLSGKAVDFLIKNGVNADLDLSAAGIDLNGRLQIIFGNPVLVKFDATIDGKNISAYLSLDEHKSGVIIVNYDGLNLGLSFNRLGDVISKLLTSFGVDLGGMDVGAIVDNIDITGIVRSFGNVKGVKLSETEVVFEPNLNSTGIPLDVPFKMVVTDGEISSFGIDNQDVLGKTVYLSLTPSESELDVAKRSIDNSVSDLTPALDFLTDDNFAFGWLTDVINNKAVSVDVSANVLGHELNGTVKLDFNDGLKFSAEVNFAGIDVSAYYGDEEVLVKIGDVLLSVDVETLKGYIPASLFDSLKEGLGDVKDIIKTIIDSIIYNENGLNVSYKDFNVSLGNDEINFTYQDKVSATVSGISGETGVVRPTGNVVKLDSTFSLNFLESVLNSKTLSLDLSAAVFGIDMAGKVMVDFNEGIKVAADVCVDGLDVSLFYADEQIFVKAGDVAVTVSTATIKDYVSVFTDKPLDLSIGDDLIGTIKAILDTLSYKNEGVSVSFEDLEVTVASNVISVYYQDKVTASISNVTSGEPVLPPVGEYANLSGLKELIENIWAQFDNRYFTINGSVTVKNVGISFADVKIYNFGNIENPTASFNSGTMDISGYVYITANGTTHKLFVEYRAGVLYVVYNDELRVKLTRSSLDYIVGLFKNEYKNIIERLNYSEILSSTDTLTKFKDYKFTIGSVGKILKGLTVENGAVGLQILASDFGFTDMVSLTAKMSDGNLALDVKVGENSGLLALNNTPFNRVAVPSGTFIDLSGITGLVEGLINAIKKEPAEYYLSGTAKINILSLKTISVNMDAAIRLIDSADGGKEIQAVAHISLYDWTVSTFAGSYIKCGEGTLIYKDGRFYIRRINKSHFFGWNTDSDTKRSMSRAYFSENFMSQLGFFMGLTDTILKEFSSSTNEMKVEKVIKSYSVSGGNHQIVLDGSEIAGSSILGDMTATITEANKQLTKLSLTAPINILSMKLNVELNHEINKTGIDYSEITGLNASSFSYQG